jgi:NADH:ubiquinone oxidoreductase subunit 6 (subunit J)
MMHNMLLETVLVVGVVASAFFAMYLEETVYAVLSLTTMFIVLSALYFSLNAPFAAVFQLAIATGTIAVFFLAGEMLTKKTGATTSLKKKLLGLAASILLSIPCIIGTEQTKTFTRSTGFSISTALWELRAVDAIAQGLVILTVALGIVFLLKKERRRS